MNCPCDEIIFPPRLVIPAGLSSLPRQIATFPEFRAALLAAIRTEPALQDWRARGSGDFGIMLLEMWAYVCDCISFYDEVIADECYLRTADLRPSLHKLVDLLGYVPRPAVASRVDLAILADGRQPISLPAGTAFRSGGFPGGVPQVFELDAANRAHPFLNRWSVARSHSATLEPGPYYTTSRDSFLLDPKTARLMADQFVLVENLIDAASTRPRVVRSVDNFIAPDGATYKLAKLTASAPIAGSTPVADVRISTPSQMATIWQHPYGFWASGLIEFFGQSDIIFDSLQRQIQLGDWLVLDKVGEYRWFKVRDMGQVMAPLPPSGDIVIDSGGTKTTVSPAPATVQVTWVRLDVSFNDPSRREGSASDWTSDDAAYIKVHLDFRKAGDLVTSAATSLQPGDSMNLSAPHEPPQDGKYPSRFLLEDHDSDGAVVTGSVNFSTGVLAAAPPLARPLVMPVTVYGNVVAASRGETVAGEVLGSGDASVASQTFKLKKSPLTYLPAPGGVSSTLSVHVNGLEWTEVPTLFGVADGEEVYIVRQNDDGDSLVTFGSPLPTGNGNVVATYRFGAGRAAPPAGAIHQMAKPVKGITSVRNPVAAFGGDDAEPASGLRRYAPRSALLLGRAISILDMEAVAAGVGDVRAVRVEWRWSPLRQRPVVQIWYIGAASIAKDILQTLRSLSDSVSPIVVEQATPVPSALSLSIEWDPRRIEADVLTAVRAALMDSETGILAPERIGIGLALFRSRIFEAVLAVPGTVAVTGLLWDGEPFGNYGIDPGAGRYFDLEAGALLLNGKAADNG